MINRKVGKIASCAPVKHVFRERESQAYQMNQPLFKANTFARDEKAVLKQDMFMEGKAANKLNYVA